MEFSCQLHAAADVKSATSVNFIIHRTAYKYVWHWNGAQTVFQSNENATLNGDTCKEGQLKVL